jgi:large subunit ribosomal protein L15
MKIHELRDNPGATKDRKRIGRGPGSGTGKTGGRGIKGQKSRSGVAIKGFEGGQMPLHRRLPKRGFNNIFAKNFAVVNLGNIQTFIDAGKLDPKAVIDEAALVQSGLVRRRLDGVRVLAKGALTSKGLKIATTGASKPAIAAVESAGGTLTVTAPAPEADATAEA